MSGNSSIDGSSLHSSITLELARPIGCSALFRGSSSCMPHFFCRILLQDKLKQFLDTEGLVFSIVKTYPHKNLPKLLSCVESVPLSLPAPSSSGKQGSIMIFPEYFSDLHSVIRTQERLPEAIARSYFSQLMNAVAHSHRHHVVLGDIRIGKIMFSDEALTQPVFADLSGSRYLPSLLGRPMDCKGMSPAYVAPEVLYSNVFEHSNPTALDIWAMGIVLYVMLVGRFPFASMDPSVLCQKIATAAVQFPSWVRPSARRLINKMLTRDPSVRPNANEILEDPWLLTPITPIKRSAEDLLPELSADPDDQIVPEFIAADAPSVVQSARKSARVEA